MQPREIMKTIQDDQRYLIQVDNLDVPVGLVKKLEAHLDGVLHRAFSVFVFRKVGSSIQLLLQQRASHKYHSGGLWTNTCCSHAEPEVPVKETAKVRLQTEMGFTCPLQFMGSFHYKADVGNGMIEHEIDHVFAAFHNPTEFRINPEEADTCKWIDVDCLKQLLKSQPHEFTVWLPEALQIALNGQLDAISAL